MSALLTRLREAARLARRDPRLFGLMLYAYLLLVVMRGVIRVVPMQRITRYLGTAMEETPREGLSAEELRYARRIGHVLHRIAPLTPTESNCYPQALTARWLLHRAAVPSTLYYGAAFERDRPSLATHVWIRSGPTVVTGAGTALEFKPLTFFADVPARSRGRQETTR